ncbi:hypothetical protein [Paludifilum halophilum]|uniref:Uncharacterized protein n=1 Tax=Paludifilum halophilum TaxID=1642702 RepID=A0A235B0Z0_9BACL|nr:hypothetical protein [Paludifilum halophilum]OYD05963.1 hypothetical protein CHM34_18870 [Paludifilum halophilum]
MVKAALLGAGLFLGIVIGNMWAQLDPGTAVSGKGIEQWSEEPAVGGLASNEVSMYESMG